MKKIILLPMFISALTACSAMDIPNSNSQTGAVNPVNQSRCLAEEAQKLVGKTGLSDAQIKQLTQSEIVRTVGPNQPVTMDYRDNRVTLTIDPVSKKIMHASCG